MRLSGTDGLSDKNRQKFGGKSHTCEIECDVAAKIIFRYIRTASLAAGGN